LLAGPLFYDARNAKQTVRLRGIVYRPDGKPLARGAFSLGTSYDQFESLATDSKGRYSCKVRVSGSLLAEACAKGVGYSKILTAPVPAGAESVTLDVPLKAIPVMTGAVSLPDGSPAANLAFQAGGEMERDLFYLGRGAGSTGGNKVLAFRTDASGRYRVPLLSDRPRCAGIAGDGTEYHLYITSPYGWAGPIDVAVRLDQPQVVRDLHLLAGERVAGTVICHPEAKPLPGVEVLAVRWFMMHGVQDLGRAVSDANGAFEIPTELPPGAYEVWARGEGLFAVGAQDQSPPSTRDGSAVHVTINMARPLRVEGVIYGPDGKPASNAEIENWRIGTDDRGRYIYQYKRQPMDGMYGTPVYCPRYLTLAPRVKGVGLASPVAVDMLGPWPDRLDFHLQQAGSLSGKVVGEDGRCPPGIYPWLVPDLAHPGGGQWNPEVFYDVDTSKRYPGSDGAFSFVDVVPGAYRLEVKGSIIHPLTIANGAAPSDTIAAGEDLGALTINLTYQPRFYAQLSDLPRRVHKTQGWVPVEVHCVLRPSDASQPPRHAEIQEQLGDRYLGWDTVYAPGRFDIVFVAECGPDRRVSQVLRGVELSEGGVAGPLAFTLTPGASITGRLLAPGSAGGIARETVRLQPLSGDALLLAAGDSWGGPNETEYLYASTDEQGRFTISGLLPGEYQITPMWSPLRYGERQTKTVLLSQDQQVTDLVFQAEKRWP
jgi:hypothetical protein